MSLGRLSLAAGLVFASGLLAPIAYAGNEALVGKWACTAETPDGELPSVWVITQTAGAVAVDVEIGGATGPAADVKVVGAILSMKVTFQSIAYDVSVTFTGDTFAGTWSGDGRQGAIKGKRG